MSGVSSSRSPADLVRLFGGGDRRVVVAILDGPVDTAHPSLSGATLTSLQSLVPTTPSGGGATAHGTHVTSIVFGQPGTPVEGVAPFSSGLIIPVFSDQRDHLACSQLDLARAIILAVEQGAHVINISGGQLSAAGDADGMLAKAVAFCARRNVLVVAAAGNDGCDCLHVPAAIDTVLAVGAMNAAGEPLASSNWGKSYVTQGLLAPGVQVPGAALPDGVARRTGTSFAAPYVSGVAALLIARQLSLGQSPDPHAVRTALLESATPCVDGKGEDCRRVLGGRINVEAAFELVSGGVAHVNDTTLILPSETAATAQKSIHVAPTARDVSSPALPPPWVGVPRVSSERGVRMSEDASVAPSAQALRDEAPFPHAERTYADMRADIGSILPSCGDDKSCGCGGAKPGGCGCGGAPKKLQLVYALGTMGVDFSSEAARDAFIQAMKGKNPYDIDQLVEFLEQAPFEAPSVIWTLSIDATPIYAVEPVGAYASYGYEQLRKCLIAQIGKGAEHADNVSIPGVIGGQTRLLSGQIVPVIVPALRGIYAWNADALAKHAFGPLPKNAEQRVLYERHLNMLGDFLSRDYFELRNLGLSGSDRALNFAATDASRVAAVIEKATKLNLELDSLSVKPSPICRADSECYDVELSFFNPNNMNIASRIFRFTVDVSDVIPVSLHEARDWSRRV